MDFEKFEELLLKYSNELNLKLNKIDVDKFYKYQKLLLEWNEKINLTAITAPQEIVLKHFVDSLTIEKYLKKGAYIVDVGTGAGFPGIPLKIVRKDIKIVLVDSLNKRINFLNTLIKELDLKDIIAIHSRAEEFGKNKEYREKFDLATSRAVANLSTLSEYLLPLVKVGGMSVCMKGSEIKEELEQSKKAISILGGKDVDVSAFNLPNSDIKRNIVIIKKVKTTPSKYPRKPGIPSKEPIK